MDELKSGDMIALSGRDLGSLGIQVGSLSLPNIWPLGRLGLAGVHHVAILAPVFGELVVYESTTGDRPPCLRTGREKPKGVQAHRLGEIFANGVDVWHYPLRRELYPHEEDRLLVAVEMCMSRGYDYMGAGRSGGGLFMRTLQRLKGSESMDQIFCAELVMWAWIQAGVAQNKHAGMNPNWLCRYALRKGICNKPRRLSLDAFSHLQMIGPNPGIFAG